MRPLVLLALLLLPTLAQAGAAQQVPQPGAWSAIEGAERQGLLDPTDALLQRYAAVFEPDALDPDFAALGLGDNPVCATSLVAELKGRWDELTPDDRHRVASHTDPTYRSWVQQGGMTWLDGDVDQARLGGRASCFAPEDVVNGAGPYSDTRTTEHFSIRYQVGGDVTHDRVELLGNLFESSLEVETTDLGFFIPQGIQDYELLVMVEDLASPGTGGYTSLNYCGPTSYMAFIVVNEAWFDSTSSLRAVASHELFHSIQMRYALRSMFQQDTGNRWYVEAAAVFMETEVHPTNYDPQFSQAFRYISSPFRDVTTWDDGGFQYGTYLLNASIRQELGTSDWFLELWLAMRELEIADESYDLLEVLDGVLAAYDTTFDEQFDAFLRRAAAGDWAFNEYLPAVDGLDEVSQGFYEDSLTASHSRYPVDEAVDSGSGLDRPEHRGANFVWFDASDLGSNQGAVFGFIATAESGSAQVDWSVQIVPEWKDDPQLVHQLELDRVPVDNGSDYYTGSILLNDFGEDFDGAWLIVSPSGDQFDGGLSWAYTVDIIDATGDGGFYPVPEPSDDDPDPRTGCASGCAAGGAARGLLLLPIVAVARRRR